MAKKRRWRHTVGTWGSRVEVYERTPGGPLSIRFWDPTLRSGRGGYERRALSRIDEYAGDPLDREAALDFANEVSKAIRTGEGLPQAQAQDDPEPLTVRQLFELYRRWKGSEKKKRVRKAEGCRLEMWERFLGPETDPETIGARQWATFKRDRASGAIDARGQRVEDPEERRAVRARTVQADLQFLKHVMRWAPSSTSTEARPSSAETRSRAVASRSRPRGTRAGRSRRKNATRPP